jgi:hypothetical protein
MEWGPIKPAQWPQDTLFVPGQAGGQLARFMPPVELGNSQVSRQESFTMSGTFNCGVSTTSPGVVFNLSIPTDQDGDFWCDQIYMVAWFTGAGGDSVSHRPPPSTISITDFRTGKNLTYPGAVPTNFFTTLILFSEDAGFDPASSPPPDGFRSTTTLPQPFCVTRQGGIQMALTMIPQLAPPSTLLIDIAFGGWKEYAYASR